MRSYQVFVKLVDENDKPLPNRSVTVQHFMVTTGRWTSGGTMRTNANGEATRAKSFASNGAAPMLRLVEAGNPARVLAHGGIVKFDTTRKVLFVDFGTIERLDDQAYGVTSAVTQTKGLKETIAGVPNRPEFRMAMMARVVAATPPAAMAINADTQRTAAAAAPTPANLAALNTQLAAFQGREVELNRQLQIKNTEIGARNAEVQTLRAQIVTKDRERTELIARLSRERQQEIARLAQEKKAEAERLEREKATIAKNLEAERAKNVKQVEVHALTANIGEQVKRAQVQMASDRTPFKMGRVEVNLKAMVNNQGQSLTLPDATDLQNTGAAGQLADVRLEFLPDSGLSDDRVKGTVPDVSQLTESAARRVLAAAGFRMESAYGAPKAGNIAPGQAFKQTPKKNTEAQKGEAVMVVFARSAGG